MKNRAAGFYLTLAAAILAVASIIMYTRAMYKAPAVFVTLAAVVVIEAVTIILNRRGLNSWLPLVGAVLMGFAAGYSFKPMVNQIGYVIAGLDQIDTLIPFIIFAGIAIVGMLLYLIAGFLKQQKDER
ncbi:hypothetical protein ACTQ1O_05555 [Bilifractor sp. LCP21S3_A7]|uniref:hypothetical protein n=1 Tax=Bilifractor sp. LCP21S3_A7 TaxID=3438738 RepID=UPI003F8F7275